MGDVHLEGLFYLCFVQHRIGRAGRLGREFRRVAGDDAAFVMSRGRGDLRREVVPRAHALVGEVVHALIARIAPRFDDREERQRQVPGVGRRADLVEDHLQPLPLRAQAQHRLQEVLPVLRIEPRRAEDQIPAARGHDGAFTRKFRTAVRPQRRRRYILCIGRMGCAVEDVVRRDVEQCRTRFFGRSREIARSLVVQQVGPRLGLLGLLHVGIGRTVHDNVDPVFPDCTQNRPGIGDVQLRDVRTDIVVGRDTAQTLQGAAKLSVRSRDQDIKHSNPYYSRTTPRPPTAAGGGCPSARARHLQAAGASRCPAWGRPTR